MIGLLVLAIILILYFLGIVGILSIIGAVIMGIGSFGALVFDETYDRIKRVAFVVIAVAGVCLIAFDLISR